MKVWMLTSFFLIIFFSFVKITKEEKQSDTSITVADGLKIYFSDKKAAPVLVRWANDLSR
jgi:hypothetical protein